MMLLKSFHPSAALYFSIVPWGTYNIALLNVFWEKVLESDIFPVILNGFSIREMTVGISAPLNA